MITPNEYQQAAMKTCGQADFYDRLIMSALGLSGETGEFADYLKKHMYHQHDFDVEKVKLEAGDILWYLALLCTTLNLSLEDVMQANIDKLRRRYPEGFSSEASKNREEYKKAG